MANLDSDKRTRDISAQSAFAKGMTVVIPASLIPDLFPQHPQIVFCAALLSGFLLQNFIAPRWWHFLPLLLLSLILVVLHLAFVK